MTKRQKGVRRLLMLLALAALAWALHYWFSPYFSTEAIDALLLQAGPWALVVYVAACVILPVFLVPAFILYVAGGIFFGPWQGALVGHLATTASAMVCFYLARWLGRPFVSRWLHGGKLEKLDLMLREHGLTAVLSVRLMPFSPFEVTSYLAGILAVKPAHFFWGTLVGNLPPTIAFSYLGASLDQGSAAQWAAAGGLMLVAAALPWLWQRHRARPGARDGAR